MVERRKHTYIAFFLLSAVRIDAGNAHFLGVFRGSLSLNLKPPIVDGGIPVQYTALSVLPLKAPPGATAMGSPSISPQGDCNTSAGMPDRTVDGSHFWSTCVDIYNTALSIGEKGTSTSLV